MKIMTKRINFKITIEDSIERHPVPVLGTDYKVKIVYKNVIPELDPAKCIEGSKDGGTYSFRVADSFGTDFNAYLGDDKKTVDITLNVEEINNC